MKDKILNCIFGKDVVERMHYALEEGECRNVKYGFFFLSHEYLVT